MVALDLNEMIFLTIAALCLGLLSLLIALISVSRSRRLLRKYQSILNGPVGTDLEALLLSQKHVVTSLENQVQALTAEVRGLQSSARHHVQHIGVVRFNAFPDTGSDLSFAVALLDAEGNGTVISSLFGRNDQRVYAKPLKAGKSTYVLTEEEQQAIDQALKR